MGLWQDVKMQFARLSVLEKLLAINIVFFILPIFINTVLFLFSFSVQERSEIISGLMSYFELSSNFKTAILRPWTFLSYGFFHASLRHLIMNMIILYLSGSLMLNLFNRRLLLNTFFIGIFSGAVIFLISYNIFPVFSNVTGIMIGSSAGVIAVLVFMASYNPNTLIRILIFSVPLKYVALVFIFLDLALIPEGNAGGHIAHLGGALWGYVYQRQFLQGNDIGGWFMNTYEALKKSLKGTPKSKRPKRRAKTTASNAVDQKQIDAILDKIASSGYESLTKAEKEYLFRAGKQ